MGKMVIILIVGLTIIVGIVSVSMVGRTTNGSKSSEASFKRTNAKNIASSAAEYYLRQLKATPSLRGTFSIPSILNGSASVQLSDWTYGSDSIRLVSIGYYTGAAETSSACITSGGDLPNINSAFDMNVPIVLSFSRSGTLDIDGRDHDINGVLLPPSVNDRPGIGLSNASEVSKILPAYAGNINGTTDVLAPVTITNPSTYIADLISRADYTYSGSDGNPHTWGSAVSPKIVYCAPTAMKFTNQCTGYGVLIIDATTFESTNKFTWRGLVIQYSTASDDCDWKTSNEMKIYGALVIYSVQDMVYESTGKAYIYRSKAALDLASTLFGGGSAGLEVANWSE